LRTGWPRESTARAREDAGTAQAPGGVAFDWIMVALCSWLIGGGLVDLWAHAHQQLIGKLETFFTPWHAVMYSGWIAVTIFLVGALARNIARGYSWDRALPSGYWLSLLGVLIFTWGGLGDMLWHTLLGIEIGVDAAYSPPHIVLGIGSLLAMSGPLRAAWHRGPGRSWGSEIPMVISLTYTWTIVGFFHLFAQPMINPWAAAARRPIVAEHGHVVGIASILLHAGIMMGMIVLSILRRPLPFGGFTILFALNGLMLAALSWPEDYRLIQLAGTTAAGFVADLLFYCLRPSRERRGALRAFSFAVPAVFYLAYFVALQVTDGVWWSVHLQTGSIALAGATGWVISYIFVPAPDLEVEHRGRRGDRELAAMD